MNDYKRYINKSAGTKFEIDACDNTQTAEVIVRFTRWAPRMRAYSLHYKKNLLIRVRCDLTKYRQDALRLSRQYLRENQLAAYVYNNAECKLIVCDTSSKRRASFNTFAELKDLAKRFSVNPAFHQHRHQGSLQPVENVSSETATSTGSPTRPPTVP